MTLNAKNIHIVNPIYSMNVKVFWLVKPRTHSGKIPQKAATSGDLSRFHCARKKGSPFKNKTYAIIFEFNGSEWIQTMLENTNSSNIWNPYPVVISDNGSRIAVAIEDKIIIYDHNGTVWVQAEKRISIETVVQSMMLSGDRSPSSRWYRQ